MTLTEIQRNQIILLAKGGSSITEIATALKVSRPTVYKVVNLAMAEIKQKAQENLERNLRETESPPALEQGNENAEENPTTSSAEGKADPDKEKGDIQNRIMRQAQKTFAVKAGSSLGQDLTEDLERYLASARVVKRYELIQRAEIEDLGIKWEDYLSWIFEKGYEAIQQEIYNQLQEENRKAMAVTPEDLVELHVQRKMIWG